MFLLDELVGPMSVKDWSTLSAPAIVGGFLLWFARWLPKHLEERGKTELAERQAAQTRHDTLLASSQNRHDALVGTFKEEMRAERESCDKRFNMVVQVVERNHEEALVELRALRAPRKPGEPS